MKINIKMQHSIASQMLSPLTLFDFSANHLPISTRSLNDHYNRDSHRFITTVMTAAHTHTNTNQIRVKGSAGRDLRKFPIK